MELCYLNITAEETSGAFLSLLDDYLPRVARPDTRVSVRSVRPALTRALDLRYTYFAFRNMASIVEEAIAAESDGFDAITIGCFEDPAVREARSVVDVPVVAMGEATLHLACQMGDSFAVVTSRDRKIQAQIARLIRAQGLRSRAIESPVRGISMSDAALYTAGMREPERVAEEVRRRAEECVADGAEVVVVGCNAIGPLCTRAGVVETERGGAPILDCAAVAIKTAEALVDLRARTGTPPVSRVSGYAMPRPADLERVRATFDEGVETREHVPG